MLLMPFIDDILDFIGGLFLFGLLLVAIIIGFFIYAGVKESKLEAERERERDANLRAQGIGATPEETTQLAREAERRAQEAIAAKLRG